MLKKLFASVSAFAVLFASVAPSLVTAAPVATDPELLDAVTWAYDAGLTKYSDANTFMPFNNLTREQAAKFASEFAETVLNLEADSTRTTVCEYKDASIMDATLVDSVTKACQQSIMMGYQGNFMPKQLLTRGQFATMVSRMLGGIDAMSTEQAHFDYLKDLGIMNVASLTSTITRGDAMLMLYRVANGSSSDLCAIDPNLPGCSTNPTTPIVKKGDLNVALNPASPVNYSSIPKDGSVKYATVDFTAGTSDVSLFNVQLTRQGLGNPTDFTRVYFEKDGVRVSSRSSVASDNKLILSFAPALVVPAGKTVSLDLYAEMKAQLGAENSFASTKIESSALNVVGNFVTATLRSAAYDVVAIALSPLGGTGATTVKGGDANIELGQFSIQNNGVAGATRDVNFKAITLRNNGNGDVVSSLSGLFLERNGVKVSTSYMAVGKDVTFTLTDTIKDSQSATYYVRGNVVDVQNTPYDTYQFTLRNSSDVNATEATTDFRVSATPTTGIAMHQYNVEAGDIKFAKDPSFVLSNSYSAGTPAVPFMKGTITTKESIYLEDLSIDYEATAGANLIAKRFFLTIGNSTFSWTPGTGSTGKAPFDGAVTINGTVNVLLWADIDTNAPAGATMKFKTLGLGDFQTAEYSATQNNLSGNAAIGTIAGASIAIASSKLNISRNDALASTVTIVKDSTDKLIYGVALSNNQDNAIRVNALTFTSSVAGFNNNVDLTLYVDGTPVSTRRFDSQTVTFSSLNKLISKGTPVAISLRATLNGTATGTMGTFALSAIDAIDTVSGKTATKTTLPIVGSIIKVVDAGSVNAIQGTVITSQLIASLSNDITVGKLNIEARNDGMKLTDAYLSLVGISASKLSKVQLVDGANSYVGTVEGDIIKFEGLSVAIASNAVKTFDIKVGVSEVAYSGDLAAASFSINVATGYTTASGATVGTTSGLRLISDANGQPVTNVNVTNPITSTHQIVAGYPVFSIDKAPTNNDVMFFKVTNVGNKVRLKSISYTSAGSAFTGTIELRDANDIVLGTGTVSSANILSFGSGVEISSSIGSTFKVYAPNYSATVNDSKRSFTITDVSFDQWTSSDGVWTNTPSIAGYKNIVGLSSFTSIY